jgi:peptidoglycan hydrolase FlgJ
MMTPSVSSSTTPVSPQEAAMRKAAKDLEGLFVQQLFKSMRETVPTDGGLTARTQGEDLFTGLMDESVAADTGTRWHRGLSDAIYRALHAKAGSDADQSVPTIDPVRARPSEVPLAQFPRD